MRVFALVLALSAVACGGVEGEPLEESALAAAQKDTCRVYVHRLYVRALGRAASPADQGAWCAHAYKEDKEKGTGVARTLVYGILLSGEMQSRHPTPGSFAYTAVRTLLSGRSYTSQYRDTLTRARNQMYSHGSRKHVLNSIMGSPLFYNPIGR